MRRTAILIAATLVAAPAFAGGTASPKPPAPPSLDLTVLPASASVQPKNMDDTPHQVHARLMADRDVLRPGDTVRLGVHLTQKHEWHTYWRSPGDIGLPTDIVWKLPDGATAGDYTYPVPQRFELAGIVSYGYEDQVLLYSEVKLPDTLPAGKAEFGAKVNWLVCKESCIPGEAELSLPITVAPDAPDEPGSLAPMFDHFEKQHPTDPLQLKSIGVESALSVSAVQPEKPFKAAFLVQAIDGQTLAPPPKDGNWPTFTPIVGFDWMVMDLKIQQVEPGILVTIEGETFAPEPLPTSDQIGGLLQVKVGDTWVRTEITRELPWVAADAEVTESNSPLWTLAKGGAAGGTPPVGGSGGGPETASTSGGSAAGGSLFAMLGAAFLGGLLLNIMPCVLPVLTMKLYGLVEQADISPTERKTAGLAYSAGIIASFLALAATVVFIQTSVGAVGWGFQFQYPPYVAALATIVFAFGLSLFGVFELPVMGGNAAADASAKEGVMGYFFTGVFATLLATPCSAPFLGTALGFAFSQPAAVILVFFAVIGLGLAAPFLAIAFIPALFRLLPSPGEWMETFKQLMGFTLIATTVWLVDVLAAQIGSDRATGFLAFLTVVGIGSWIFGRWGGLAETGKRQLTALAAGAAVSVAGGYVFLDLEMAHAEVANCDGEDVDVANLDFSEQIPWVPFSEPQIEALSGHPVFIDFTADWCLTCKVNENTILETDRVRSAMKDLGVVPVKADWTRRDPVIGEWLARYDRAAVPFYVVLPADPAAGPIPLGEVITPDGVIEAMQVASKR